MGEPVYYHFFSLIKYRPYAQFPFIPRHVGFGDFKISAECCGNTKCLLVLSVWLFFNANPFSDWQKNWRQLIPWAVIWNSTQNSQNMYPLWHIITLNNLYVDVIYLQKWLFRYGEIKTALNHNLTYVSYNNIIKTLAKAHIL